MKMSKLKDQWQKYLATVPGLEHVVTKPKPPVEDSDVEYGSFVGQLPSDVGVKLSDASPKQSEELHWEHTVEHHWCLCEMPEGDFPRVFAFPSLQRLVEAIAKREGDETAVWPMYGIPLRMTKAIPNPKNGGALTRYLLLPNQLAAVVSAKEPYRLIEQSVLPSNIETQEEGWLGDPTMLEQQGYFLDGFVEEDDFSVDPDMDDDEQPNYEE
jgi:hypothetical protein